MLFRLSFSLSVILLLAACAPPKVSLTKQAQQNIEKADHVLVIPQNNLDITVQATNPGNSGLLGALIAAVIDSSRQSSAEESATPIIKVLEDYDFRSVMQKSVSVKSKYNRNLRFSHPIHINKINSESQRRISFDNSSASAVLFSTINYRLQDRNLTITATSEMYPKSTKLLPFRYQPDSDSEDPLDAGNIIYRKSFTFTKQAITPYNIKASLTEGANSISKQILDDLNHPL